MKNLSTETVKECYATLEDRKANMETDAIPVKFTMLSRINPFGTHRITVRLSNCPTGEKMMIHQNIKMMKFRRQKKNLKLQFV